MTAKLILLGIIIIFIPSCEQLQPELSLNEKLEFNESEYHLAFKIIFAEENFSAFNKDSSFQYIDTLKEFYSSRNFQPLFIKSFEEEDFVDSLLIIFEQAGEHGLNPEQYHLSSIVNQFYTAINDTITNLKRFEQLANTELLISDAILKYSYHLRYGVIDPTKILLDSYYLPIPDSSERDLFEPLRQNNIIQYLQDIQPKNEKYKKLQAALKKFKSYQGIEWEILPESNKKIEPGKSDSLLIPIAEKLITLGYLDTSAVKIIDFTLYDSLLVMSVKKFQRLNGLNDDGVIGKSTIEKLNVSPEEHISKIKLNLERFRWNDYSDTSQYILVNIPDYMLYVIDNKKELFNIKVCLGIKRSVNYDQRFEVYKKSKRIHDKPDDWQTPVLYGEISHLVLNPTWTVPQSIMREEILAGIREDSSYLAKKNFKVYREGVEIDHGEVNLSDFASQKIPYLMVQDPGAGNALGKIKFMFNNPFGVYLHDTPTRAPFGYSNRAVSHGCIRVEKPIQLAEFILQDHSKWNVDYLKIEIGQKVDDKSVVTEYYKKRESLRKNVSLGKTTDLILEKKIPLFIDYYTAWVDKDGEINFRDDIYRQDKALMEHLISYIN